MPKVLDVDEVSKHPEVLKGNVGIVGNIYKIIKKKGEPKTILMTACFCDTDSGCSSVPVVYEGEIPETRKAVIIYGKVNLEDGYRFIKTFDAYKINLRKDDLKGEIFYFIRKEVRKGIKNFRTWLYVKCKQCFNLKKKLIPISFFPTVDP
jgi:hypothetical protein